MRERACKREYQRFVSELALRGPLSLPAEPEPRKLDADTLALAGTGGEPYRAPLALARQAPSAAPYLAFPSISRRLILSAQAARDQVPENHLVRGQFPPPVSPGNAIQEHITIRVGSSPMDAIEFRPARDQHAFTGAASLSEVQPGTMLRLWTDYAFCGNLRGSGRHA